MQNFLTFLYFKISCSAELSTKKKFYNLEARPICTPYVCATFAEAVAEEELELKGPEKSFDQNLRNVWGLALR